MILKLKLVHMTELPCQLLEKQDLQRRQTDGAHAEDADITERHAGDSVL